MIADQEKVARLRLARSDNVGPITYQMLLQRFGSAEAALAALPDLSARGGARKISMASLASAKAEIAAIERAGAQLLLRDVAPYPSLLARIEDAPPVLIVRGHIALFERPAVAIVGARNASAIGLRMAATLAAGLGEVGYVISSGLARGIDSAAHQATLATGTIAAVAGGIDVIFPPENARLYDQIGSQGLLLGEQPLGTVPQGRHFPRRNRVISGLAQGVVIVEAALKSGSLITARFAGEQGREVMAVPGSPLDPRAQGCNQLIREGATLVQSTEDVIEAIRGWRPGGVATPAGLFSDQGAMPTDPSPSDRLRLLELLGYVPVAIDELIRLTDMQPAQVHIILLELELAGRLQRLAGQRVLLTPPDGDSPPPPRALTG